MSAGEVKALRSPASLWRTARPLLARTRRPNGKRARARTQVEAVYLPDLWVGRLTVGGISLIMKQLLIAKS